MPHLTPASWTLWVIVALLQISVLVIVTTRKLGKRWPSILAFSAFKSLLSLFLMGITILMQDTDERAAIYFYTYWAGAAIVQAIEIWIIIQIADNLGGCTQEVRHLIHTGIIGFSICALAFSSYLAIQSPMHPSGRIATGVIDISRAVTLASLATFLITVGASEFLGILWNRINLGIAIGLAIIVCGQMAISWILALFPIASLSDVNSGVYAAGLIIWALHLSKNDQNLVLPAKEAVAEVLRHYHAAVQRLNQNL